MRKAILATLSSIAAAILAQAASFSPDGSFEGACGSLSVSKDKGEVEFMNGSGDKFSFHVSCSNPERKWFCGWYMEDKKLIIDQAAKSAAFNGRIAALGQEPASNMNFAISELPGGLVKIEAKFDCKGDAKKLYNAELKMHVSGDFTAEGKGVSVDGSPLVFENDMVNPGTKKLYSGKAAEIDYQMAPGKTLRLMTLNSSNASVSQLYNKTTGKYYTEIKYELGSGNAVAISADFGDAPKEARANVYEGIDFNTNRFLVPNYNLSRNLVQNPSF